MEKETEGKKKDRKEEMGKDTKSEKQGTQRHNQKRQRWSKEDQQKKGGAHQGVGGCQEDKEDRQEDSMKVNAQPRLREPHLGQGIIQLPRAQGQGHW